MNITAPTIYFAMINFQAPSYILGNVSTAKRFNEKVIEAIGMRKLGESIAYEVASQLREQGGEAYHDEGGVSCISLLSTSSIDTHTWPDITPDGKIKRDDPGYGYVCVQSCRDFEVVDVTDVIIEVYKATSIHVNSKIIPLHG